MQIYCLACKRIVFRHWTVASRHHSLASCSVCFKPRNSFFTCPSRGRRVRCRAKKEIISCYVQHHTSKMPIFIVTSVRLCILNSICCVNITHGQRRRRRLRVVQHSIDTTTCWTIRSYWIQMQKEESWVLKWNYKCNKVRDLLVITYHTKISSCFVYNLSLSHHLIIWHVLLTLLFWSSSFSSSSSSSCRISKSTAI